MKPILKKMSFRIAKDQILQITPAPPPVVHIADYVISNHKFLQKKKCSLMVHPRKIAKHLPGVAVSDIINSDWVNGPIKHIHDERIHNAALLGLKAIKVALMLI